MVLEPWGLQKSHLSVRGSESGDTLTRHFGSVVSIRRNKGFQTFSILVPLYLWDWSPKISPSKSRLSIFTFSSGALPRGLAQSGLAQCNQWNAMEVTQCESHTKWWEGLKSLPWSLGALAIGRAWHYVRSPTILKPPWYEDTHASHMKWPCVGKDPQPAPRCPSHPSPSTRPKGGKAILDVQPK